jgi:hypothetical protein
MIVCTFVRVNECRRGIFGRFAEYTRLQEHFFAPKGAALVSSLNAGVASPRPLFSMSHAASRPKLDMCVWLSTPHR